MTAHTNDRTAESAQLGGPGLWEIHSGRARRNPDGTAEVTTTIRAKKRPPGTVLLGWAGWLLLILAAGVMAVSYAGQFAYILAARHQVIASNIEAAMFDVGMIIFAVLGLALARLGKPARAERALVIVCALGSAVMGYAAADVASPRSVIVYVAPPLFLAVCVDRLISVVRRHMLGVDEASPWRPLGAALTGLARCAGLVLLYSLRLALDAKETARGLRQVVLNAAPLPAAPPRDVPQAVWQTPQAGSKKDTLITLYRQDPRHGNRQLAARAAADLAPRAGLQAGTARTYINDYLAALNGAAS